MPYSLASKRNRRKARRSINIHQNKFTKAYVSTIDDSRRPTDSLSDMTNMELVQDNVVRPRPPLVRYGTQPANTVIGRGKFTQDGDRYLLWMLDDGANGVLYKQKDGESYTVLGGSNTFDDSAWAGCVQAYDSINQKSKVYVYNGVDNLAYIDLTDDSVNKYTALSTPSISSVTYSGTAGSSTHYYRVSANNAVGESIASAVSSDNNAKDRDSWVENTDYITVSWASVPNATSYTVYYGNTATTLNELYTVGTDATSFVDYGTLAVNPFKLAPEGNSTEGAIFTYMYVDSKNSQVFGITADNYLYYSAPGTGDFSPYNGGGYVGIEVDGDTTLNYVDGFRNGKGDPVITVSARGAAGKGKLFHVTFSSLTVGDQVIVYPDVYEANGQSGTYAPRATVKARDALYYPTGQDFKSTGTSQNIVNILTTNTISQGIEPDVDNLSLAYLNNAVGVEYQDRLYFALPVGSTVNNEIWYLDLARKNAWVLRWEVSAKDMWLYEDNAGTTHFCVLVDNVVLEFKRAGSQTHQDDGTAFSSRVAFDALVWDEDGINMGKIRRQYYKLLYPKGTITANATGLSRSGVEASVGTDTYTVTTTFTHLGAYDTLTNMQIGDDPGVINVFGKSVEVLEIKPKGLVNQLSWEVVADTAGTDYILSAVNTKGFSLENLVLKTD